jgi:hypothetical protein
MTPQIDINLSQGIWQRFQQAKLLVKDHVNSLTNSAQHTANQASDQAINTVTTTWEQAKESVAQSLQTAEQIQSKTSVAVQSAINSSMNDWLAQHPVFLKLVQILNLAANHPIISCVIFLFMLAFAWSIIKAMMRLIEAASLSILQAPIKLLQALFKVSFLSLKQFASFAFQRTTANQPDDGVSVLLTDSQINYQDKQQRLTEISQRLEAIQKEQHELLQEAANLIASGTINLNLEEIKFSNYGNHTVIPRD